MTDVTTVVISAVAGAAAGTGGGIVKDRFLAQYQRALEDRGRLAKLQSRYKGRMLEAALDWDRRMMQLYEGAYRWLDPPDKLRTDPEQYYFQSVVFRFLQLTAIARRFEAEAFYLDATVAKQSDFNLLRFAKAFLWVMTHAEISPNDGQPGKDHFRSDAFRPMLDLCYSTSPEARLPETRSGDELIFDLERYLAMLKLARKDGEEPGERKKTYRGYVDDLLALLDGVRPDDYETNGRQRRRWDRLVALHLITLGFIEACGYDEHKGDVRERIDAAVSMLLDPETLTGEFELWLPRLGLGRRRALRLVPPAMWPVRSALKRVVAARQRDGTVDELDEERAARVHRQIINNRRARRLPGALEFVLRPRTTWRDSDYGPLSEPLGQAARAAIELAHVQEGDRVLDLACGTGTAALLSAERDAHTVAIDREPMMIERARRRNAAWRVDWRLGDLTALPVNDDAFSVVLSVFGVMYAQDHQAVAHHLARCCAPGARVVLTAWSPGSFMPEMGRVLAPDLPPRAHADFSSSQWGEADALRELFEPRGVVLQDLHKEEIVVNFENADAATEVLLGTAGHVAYERARLEREGRWEALRERLKTFVVEHNHDDDGHVRLSLEYVLVVGRYEPQR